MTASDWLTVQIRASAARLAAADPTLLSAVGRSLRDSAIRIAESEASPPGRHLRLVRDLKR